MTTAQVVEISVTVNNNSPIQDYVHPYNQTQPTFGSSIIVSKITIKDYLLVSWSQLIHSWLVKYTSSHEDSPHK